MFDWEVHWAAPIYNMYLHGCGQNHLKPLHVTTIRQKGKYKAQQIPYVTWPGFHGLATLNLFAAYTPPWKSG